MLQHKSRRILFAFLLATVLYLMYRTSYTFYYNTSNRYGGAIKITGVKDPIPENLGIVTVNMAFNKKILRNKIVCGPNATCENTNTSSYGVLVKSNARSSTKDGLIDYFQNYEAEKNELCPMVPPHLGPVPGDKSIVGLYGIESMYIDIVVGGIHSPPACIARQNAAIIVPLHDTNERIRKFLGSFIYYMHPFLMKQQLAYQLFVIYKLNATLPYKRGELYNIGFEVAQMKRPEGWMCFIFHDPDIVPEDTRNLYRCTTRPRRLIADSRKPPRFGGAISIKPDVFIKINGFSNLAWNEDDDYIDMYRRLIIANTSLETNVFPIGKYSPLSYLTQINNKTIKRSHTTPSLKKSTDGLNNVKLTIISIEYKQLYTLVTVVE